MKSNAAASRSLFACRSPPPARPLAPLEAETFAPHEDRLPWAHLCARTLRLEDSAVEAVPAERPDCVQSTRG